MSEKTKPLSVPANPLLELQKMNLEEMNRPVAEEADVPALNKTGERESGDAAIREDGITEKREDGKPGSRTAARTAVRERGRMGGKPEGRAEGRKGAPSGGDIRERVQARLGERRLYSGGVKSTVDISEELSSRIRRYCADHRGVTLRALVTELVEAYLDEEGY